ncbi:MAG TPA: hypothetical protein VI844_02030 [Coxiellaceae bacterium]|nr:hypothetical protein [Coxiellaceae bacterium]
MIDSANTSQDLDVLRQWVGASRRFMSSEEAMSKSLNQLKEVLQTTLCERNLKTAGLQNWVSKKIKNAQNKGHIFRDFMYINRDMGKVRLQLLDGKPVDDE